MVGDELPFPVELDPGIGETSLIIILLLCLEHVAVAMAVSPYNFRSESSER
jgi:hypothetical protein